MLYNYGKKQKTGFKVYNTHTSKYLILRKYLGRNTTITLNTLLLVVVLKM